MLQYIDVIVWFIEQDSILVQQVLGLLKIYI